MEDLGIDTTVYIFMSERVCNAGELFFNLRKVIHLLSFENLKLELLTKFLQSLPRTSGWRPC